MSIFTLHKSEFIHLFTLQEGQLEGKMKGKSHFFNYGIRIFEFDCSFKKLIRNDKDIILKLNAL